MVEQFLDDAKHFVSIFKVSCEVVDVDNDVYQRDVGGQIRWDVRACYLVYVTITLRYLKLELTADNLVKLLEDAVFTHRFILFELALNNIVHTI